MQSTPQTTPDATVPVSIRLPAALLARIDEDVRLWNKTHPKSPDTRTDRIIYLLEYAYDAGTLNQFIDMMKAQYMNAIATTPEALRAGAAGFAQVEHMADQVNDIDDKLDMLLSRP